jgi:dTDP-4-amino-4,6-dideoxygalactose transaminase
MILFNKPHTTGKESDFFADVINKGKYSGNGYFTRLCNQYFEEKYGFNKCLLTTSCTDALEMCAILSNIKFGDEVIIPSYTFVSTALAFVRQGASVVFADSSTENPNIDSYSIERLITNKTKAIVVVHYAGCACDMFKIAEIAKKYGIILIEDAAHAIDSYYVLPEENIKIPLGSMADLAAFSFHETKNIQCGEGGMLVVNNKDFIVRSEIILEKGTNRAEFFRGEVNKYEWVDVGSSFLPSEYTAAFLYAQLLELESIQKKRIEIWNLYYEGLKHIDQISIPELSAYATNNAHMFYFICQSLEIRTELIDWMRNHNVQLTFHYLCLHTSMFFKKNNQEGSHVLLPNADRYSNTLVRLPLYFDITKEEVALVISLIESFFKSK